MTYWLLLLACVDPGDTGSTDSPLTTGWWLSFTTCPDAAEDCAHTAHLTQLATSSDGSTFTLDASFTPHTGSVPDPVVRDDVLYLFNPGTVRRQNLRSGSWDDTPVPATVTDGDTVIDWVDPSAVVDEDGLLVLFFLIDDYGDGSDPASCPPELAPCTKRIASATEVTGSEGTAFTLDEGDRAIYQVDGPVRAADPDIFASEDGYTLLVGLNGGVHLRTSPTLRGEYTQEGMLTETAGSVPSGEWLDGWTTTILQVQDGGPPSGLELWRHSDSTGLDEAAEHQVLELGFSSMGNPGLTHGSGSTL